VVSTTPQPFYPGIQRAGGWVRLRASLDDMEKKIFLALPELEPRPLGRLASQSLYRLRYRNGHPIIEVMPPPPTYRTGKL
jgi:hypothetical protein